MNTELENLKKYKISNEEFDLIQKLIGRKPIGVEWAIFSALWSEHCSYKSSKNHLKKLYSKHSRVLEAEGENAGVIDLGLGEKLCFKIESHNHPSFIEPYQGAATGVGGIVRDIFTMGARPVALANYLCFGSDLTPRMKYLVDGVVRGIGDYGNCIGVPMLTGKTQFHKSYNKNILVNAMCVGYFGKNDVIALSKAKGIGNFVVYVGAKTGRDGVHGAVMASDSFEEGSQKKLKINVQIGDPFYEKLLIESCLEVINKKIVVAIQDMGAAGLISSSFEMASKGEVGMEIELDKVPLRDETLTPEEILVSESQERMLLVCEPSKFEEIQKIFHKWDLDANVIGKIINKGQFIIKYRNEILTSIDPDILVEKAPRYDRPIQTLKLNEIHTVAKDLTEIFNDLNSVNKKSIFKQFDQKVGASTLFDCENTIGIFQLPESKRFISISLGGRSELTFNNPYFGGFDSVFFPSLKMAIKGFLPLAMTDGLNFGNPQKSHIMGEFSESLKGMSLCAESLQTPIISGNVSFYNETADQNILPTICSGVIGLKETEDIPSDFFKNDRETIYLMTLFNGKLNLQNQTIQENNTDYFKIIEEIKSKMNTKYVTSSRVVSQEGIAYTLFLMSQKNILPNVSYIVSQNIYYQIIISTNNESVFENEFSNFEILKIGTTQKNEFILNNIKIDYKKLNNKYNNSWRDTFGF